MTKTPKTYKFNSKTLSQINDIQKHHGLSSATAALEFLVNKEHRMITPQPVKRIVNTIILKDKDKDTTLYNVSSGEQHWAELETAGDVEVVEEGTEYFCPDGLYVVEGDEWKEVECFHLDEYAAYYIEGGRPAFVTFANIVHPTRGSEVAKPGLQGEVYEVEGAALCVSSDGFSWEWVEEEEEVELPSREECLVLGL